MSVYGTLHMYRRSLVSPPLAKSEEGTTKHNWSARCQYNVTGWVSMWAYDMLSQ